MTDQFLAAYLADSIGGVVRPDDYMIAGFERIEDGYRIEYSWLTRNCLYGDGVADVTALDLMAFAWRGVQP